MKDELNILIVNAFSNLEGNGMKKKIGIINNHLLKPHEKISIVHLRRLMKQIKKDGFIKNPIIVDKNTMIILDGHHRFNVSKMLKLSSSPVYLC